MSFISRQVIKCSDFSKILLLILGFYFVILELLKNWLLRVPTGIDIFTASYYRQLSADI